MSLGHPVYFVHFHVGLALGRDCSVYYACVSVYMRRADCLCLKLQTVDALIFRRILLINRVEQPASYPSAALLAAGRLPEWEVLLVEHKPG